MGNKKRYSVGIDKVCEGTDTELHGDLKLFRTIQKVTKELGEWQEQNDKRAFFLIAADVTTAGDLSLAVGGGGDDKILAIMMHGAMNANEDLKKALYTARKLQDEMDIDNNSNEQFN